MSSDVEQEFFCDGMAEEIISALTRVEGLHVAARTSAFQFKGQRRDVREVGETLGVSTVLDGSVRKSGNRVRIITQLIDVATGYHMWSQRFDRELDDVFAIQDEISLAIVDTLQAKLSIEKRGATAVSVGRPPVSQEIYDLYVRGRYFMFRATKEEVERGIDYLQRAIALDPTFAPAHAALSFAFSLLGANGLIDTGEACSRGEGPAVRAMELDDSLAEAHQALAALRYLQWDWLSGERESKRTLELNPGFADGHRFYSMGILVPLGRLDEALAEIRVAHQLDPLSIVINQQLGLVLYYARKHDQAIRQLRYALEMEPNFGLTAIALSDAYSAGGQPEMVLAVNHAHLRRSGRKEAAEELSNAFASSGEEGIHRWSLRQLESRRSRLVTPYTRARLHARLGEEDDALEWLKRALEAHTHTLVYAGVDPVFDGLRDDPRMKGVLEGVGLRAPANPDGA